MRHSAHTVYLLPTAYYLLARQHWPCVSLVKYSSSSSCPPPRLPFGSYVQALNVSLVLLLIMNLLDVVMFERLNLHVGVPDWIFMLGKVRHAMYSMIPRGNMGNMGTVPHAVRESEASKPPADLQALACGQ